MPHGPMLGCTLAVAVPGSGQLYNNAPVATSTASATRNWLVPVFNLLP